MNELKIVALVLPILAPVLAGWLAVRCNVLKATDSKALTSAYLYLFLPALIVDHLSTQNLASLFNLRFIVATLLLMLGIYGAVLLVERLLLRRELASCTLAAFGAAKFNAVIVGLPLLLIAIGKQAIPAVIINMVLGYFTILPLTLLLLEIARGQEQDAPANYVTVLRKAFRQVCLDPLVLSTVVGLLIAAIRVMLPDWLHQSLGLLANGAVPVPLVAVGMTIAAASYEDYKDCLNEAIWISAVRIIASPVVAIGIAKLFDLSPAHSIVLVISFSLPTAKMAFAIAEDHGVYVKAMAAIVTLTTVSIAVIYPVFIWICEHLWPGIIQQAN